MCGGVPFGELIVTVSLGRAATRFVSCFASGQNQDEEQRGVPWRTTDRRDARTPACQCAVSGGDDSGLFDHDGPGMA
jgi:hypothetical protein